VLAVYSQMPRVYNSNAISNTAANAALKY